MKTAFVCSLSLLILASCATSKVRVNSVFTEPIQTESLNLVSTMIGPVYQPVLPLIDASIFNEKTNKIASQIMDEEQQMVNDYKEKLLNNLREKLGIPVNTPNQWDAEKTSTFKIDKGIQIENKNFPVVFFGENDLNVTSFGKGKNVYEIFKNDPELKTRIKALNSTLNLNNVVLSYNRIAVLNAGTFGLVGNVRLESYLFLYNSNGDLVIDAYGFTKPNPIKGKELKEYKTELDKFEEINGKLTQELSKYFKK